MTSSDVAKSTCVSKQAINVAQNHDHFHSHQVAIMQCHRQDEVQIGHWARRFTNILQQECSVQECEISCGIAEDWAQCGAKGSISSSAEGSQVNSWLRNGCRTYTDIQETNECLGAQNHTNVKHI